ncbi:PC-esterase domain-containing protein 1A-like [Bombina bombina]|uniref:PC-esterase domain-containing protein 1A-like n=1 Tax=Bombina bombina TaxID=8345 RepID=UPI00235AB94D|nr:PC-esterase domain-containing protein 1A-like [Bombina bombina]
MHNGVDYREVRQYCSDHHLVRFYFLTRVYSAYLESILSDFQAGLQPDVVIMNSCIWDITRYGQKQMEEYKTNLDLLFTRLDQVLHRECLVVWNTAMPVGYKGGELSAYVKCNLRWDIVEGNFYSATLADLYKMDVLDFHYHFRVDLRHRCRDAIHWNQVAHRKFTQILLTHIACAWRVEVPDTKRIEGCNFEGVPPRMVRWNKDNACPYKNPRMNERRGCYWDANPTSAELCLLGAMSACVERPLHSVIDPCFLDDSPQIVGTMMPGYLSFDGNYCNENGSLFGSQKVTTHLR